MSTMQAYSLFHEGLLALSEAEQNGINIDVPYCREMQIKLDKEADDIEKSIFDSELGKEWTSRHRSPSIVSQPQLADIIYNVLKIPPAKFTKNGKPAADKDIMAGIDHPILNQILRYKKLKKMSTTYLKNLIDETNDDGRLRPFFNLQTVNTYRSSSDSPNFQNFPIRDKEMGKIIRSAILPSKGNRLVETDYAAIEVRIACCYHKDPTMIKYLTEGYDMHKAMACECFLLPEEEVSKMTRYVAKNMFVFPEFYGSFYLLIAPNMWKAIDTLKLATNSGTPMYEWLKENGINTSEQFMEHIKEVEYKFWFERFPVYHQWRKSWWNQYCERGYFDSLTGFRFHGTFRRNEAINYPVQSVAFHCLLKSFTRITEELKIRKMKSKLVGQIHDSIIGDVPEVEFKEYCSVVRRVMTTDLMNDWKWINVPIDVEIEATDVDCSWNEKKVVEE